MDGRGDPGELGCKSWVPLERRSRRRGWRPRGRTTEASADRAATRGGPGAALVNLRDEIRECPATYGLAASWVVVYLAMLAVQGGGAEAGGFFGLGAIDPRTTELFGDLTWRDFARGRSGGCSPRRSSTSAWRTS